MKNVRSRGWIVVCNNYTERDIVFYMDQELLGYRYLSIGFEKGSKKQTPHMQMYCYFDNPRWYNSIKKLFYPDRVEPQKGTLQQAVDYTQKDGDYIEFGDKPEAGKVNKEYLDHIMKNPFDNFHLYNQYKKSYNELVNREKVKKDRELKLISCDCKYTAAQIFQDDVYIDSGYSGEGHYDGEKACILHPCPINLVYVDDWIHGFPRKYKYGYELKYYDPDVIMLMYGDEKQREDLYSRYIEYFGDPLE